MEIELPITIHIDFSENTIDASKVTLPLVLPMSFGSVNNTGEKYSIKLPITLPMEFKSDEKYSIKLPITLPMTFSNGKIATVKLPVTLPMSFTSKSGIKRTIYITYRENVSTEKYHGTTLLPYKEIATGKVTKIPYKETGWYFPGLILSENVITSISSQLNLVENVQALILVDFELMSMNTLKLTWYGHTVPSFTIMKKSAVDETYTESGSYNWSAEYAAVDIESEEYNIYLQGSANSGTSAVYTIAGVNDVIVEPDIDVTVNDKIYELDVNYTSVYRINIEY